MRSCFRLYGVTTRINAGKDRRNLRPPPPFFSVASVGLRHMELHWHDWIFQWIMTCCGCVVACWTVCSNFAHQQRHTVAAAPHSLWRLTVSQQNIFSRNFNVRKILLSFNNRRLCKDRWNFKGKFYFTPSINKACSSQTTRPSVHSFHYSPCFPQYGRHELKKKNSWKTVS